MMTKQEVFDTVYHHLLAQGCKSVNAEGDCQYRGPGGTKCAAGVLIKDGFYQPAFEDLTAFSPLVAAALEKSGMDPAAVELVGDLQITHDHYDPEIWPVRLGAIANLYGLQVPA